MKHSTIRTLCAAACLAAASGAGIALATGPGGTVCPDTDRNGVVDLADLNAVLGSFGQEVQCPPLTVPCCFTDIRTTVMDSDLDPPDIQANYDAINRTTVLLEGRTLAQILAEPAAVTLDYMIQRVTLVEPCTGLPTDEDALVGALLEAIGLIGPLPVIDIVSQVQPDGSPAVAAFQILSDAGLMVFPLPADPVQAAQFQQAALGVIGLAPNTTLTEFLFLAPGAFLPDEAFALRQTVLFGLCGSPQLNNRRCAGECPDIPTLDKCFPINATSWCNLARNAGNGCGIKSIASNDCP
jgi:hypothetical protein